MKNASVNKKIIVGINSDNLAVCDSDSSGNIDFSSTRLYLLNNIIFKNIVAK